MTGGDGDETVMTSRRVLATRPPASLTAPHHTFPESSLFKRLMASVPLRYTIHLPSLELVDVSPSYVNNSGCEDELLLLARPCVSRCQKTNGCGEPWTGQSR